MQDIRLDKFKDLYNDERGNTARFKGGGNPHVSICFEGDNNTVECEEHLMVSGQLDLIIRGDNNYIKIDRNVKFIGKCTVNFIHEGTNLRIGEACIINNIEIVGFGKSVISIGKKCTFARNNNIYCHPFSRVVIGEDVMTSYDVIMQTGDGHTIFDLKEGKNINTDIKNIIDGYMYEIILGNHVWVGRRVYILGGRTEIGEGSVLGAQSLVKGKFPNNVIIAGDPAKIIRKDIAWSRQSGTSDLSDCAGYVKYTIENE